MRPGLPDFSLRILAPVDALGVPKHDPTYRSPEEKWMRKNRMLLEPKGIEGMEKRAFGDNPHGTGGAFRGVKGT